MATPTPTPTTASSSKKTPRRKADVESAKIGFVGCGRIATAIINGLVVYGKVNATRIFVAAPTLINSDTIKAQHKGIRTTKRNIDIFGRYDCDIVFICVPPHAIRNLYKIGGTKPAALTTNYIPNMRHAVYVLSLVFGFTINQIKECLLNPENPHRYSVRFHRMVISGSASYGTGLAFIDVEPDSTKLNELVRNLVNLIAKLEHMPESMMDATCALAGSGLSFCYYFIGAIADGALKVGLPRAQAIKFTAKVASVAAQTMLETGKNASQLKDEAATPSGGAIYGLSVMDKADVSSAVCGAVEAAFKRAQHLALNGPE